MLRLRIAVCILVPAILMHGQEPSLHADSSTLVKLAGGAQELWSISLPEGKTANLEVSEQEGLAGILSVLAADGSKLVEADFSQRAPAAKKLLISSSAAQVRIEPTDHSSHQRIFEIRISGLRAITGQDRMRTHAEQLLGDGERLQRSQKRSELQHAAQFYAQALAFYLELSDPVRQADSLLHVGSVHYLLGETNKAMGAYQRALDLWMAKSDRAGMAAAYCPIAQISFESGQQSNAENSAKQCLELERSLNDPGGLAAALSVQGQLDARHSRSAEARADYQEGIEMARRAGDQDLEGNLLTLRGDFAARQADWEASKESHERALAIGRMEDDKLLIARSLGNLASTYIDTGELRKAVGYLEEALPLKEALSDPNSYATSLYNLANAHSKLDDYDTARKQYVQALAIFRRTRLAVGQAYVLTAFGHLALNTGNETEAEKYFREAQVQWRAGADRQGQVFALNARGDVAARGGQFSTAIQFHRQALAIAHADNLPREEERTLGYLADAYSEAHDAASSLDQASAELEVIQKIGDPEGEARALYQEGRAWRVLKQYDRAEQALRKALELETSLGARTRTADALYELAALERDRGSLREANSTVAKALDILDATGAGAGSAETRMLFAASHRKTYDLAVSLAMDQHDDARAIELTERARARTFVDLIRGARLDIRQGVDPALLERERRIQESLNEKQDRLARFLAASHTDAAASQARKEIDDIVENYESVEAEIRRTSPRYAALIEPHTLRLADIQAELPDSQTALVEFWLGEERSYGWLVDKSQCQGFELPARQEIEGLARRVYSDLTARNVVREETPEQRELRITSSDREFAQAAAQLSRMLLGPMKDLANIRTLWIVSSGALEYVPFAALPAPASRRPLAAEYRTVNLPSASALAEVKQEMNARPKAGHEIAVFADPVFQADDARVIKSKLDHRTASGPSSEIEVPRAAEEIDLASLPRLWFSRREANAVTALVPRGEVQEKLDFDASRAEAEKPALAGYRIVHFATHAFLDSHHPELSGLVLSMVDREGRPQDGFLRLNEIYNLKLNADLVVLSGCQTALGHEVRSEGLVGLTRGFMYAGAPQVVASLWDIRDRATAEFMSKFYEPLLHSHLSPEAALRSAQLAMMKDARWSQPYYWAAFTVQGVR